MYFYPRNVHLKRLVIQKRIMYICFIYKYEILLIHIEVHILGEILENVHHTYININVLAFIQYHNAYGRSFTLLK